jgi:hypothetical protein
MKLAKQFYELIYENTGLKRNNLSDDCAKLTSKYSDKIAIEFALYILAHKHSLITIDEQLDLFKKENNYE